MTRKLFYLFLTFALVSMLASVAMAQGRGRGNGQGRQTDIFGNDANNRGRNQDWKCQKFVNCRDARDGRWDGRGPRRATGFRQNRNFYTRGSRVGYRRYSLNDYWRRHHLTDGSYNRRWIERRY